MEKSNKNFLNFFVFREKSWAGPWAMGKLRPKVHQVSNTWPKEEIVHMATVLLCAADGRKITCGRRFNALFFSFSARRARAPWKRHPNARTRVISFQMKRIQVEGTLFFFFFCVGTADGCWPVARWCQVPQTVCDWNFVRTLRHWAKCPTRLFIWITLNGKV